MTTALLSFLLSIEPGIKGKKRVGGGKRRPGGGEYEVGEGNCEEELHSYSCVMEICDIFVL